MSDIPATPAPAREARRGSKRRYRIAAKKSECDLIASFVLVPEDGDDEPLRPFLPGQHLTFTVPVPGERRPVIRSYSFSDCPEETDHYRLTIKKEPAPPGRADLPPGLVSNHLVDHVGVDDVLEGIGPRGAFHLRMESTLPVVLLSGGVGLTPMVSIYKHMTRAGSPRPVWYIHGCLNGRLHALADDVRQASRDNPLGQDLTFYAEPGADDIQGRDYDHAGFITADHLRSIVPGIAGCECYLCGPTLFMQIMYKTLLSLGVAEENILYEFFGDATILKDGPGDGNR